MIKSKNNQIMPEFAFSNLGDKRNKICREAIYYFDQEFTVEFCKSFYDWLMEYEEFLKTKPTG